MLRALTGPSSSSWCVVTLCAFVGSNCNKMGSLMFMWPCIVIKFLIIKPIYGICHTGLLTARQLSANLYDIYHCYLHSEKLLIMEENCPKHVEFYSKNKFEKLVHLVDFIIRKMGSLCPQVLIILTSQRISNAFHFGTCISRWGNLILPFTMHDKKCTIKLNYQTSHSRREHFFLWSLAQEFKRSFKRSIFGCAVGLYQSLQTYSQSLQPNVR